jgi:hypothetical protein
MIFIKVFEYLLFITYLNVLLLYIIKFFVMF